MIGKPALRNALRKLRAVEARCGGDLDPVETGQEMLDFLAMLTGLKPVFQHGRAFADARWVTGVVETARGLGLRVLEGPCWNLLPPGEPFPAWYAECVESEFAPYRPFSICKAPAVAREVAAINAAGGRASIEQEARLLGYPECCVAAHHRRSAAFHRYAIERIGRLAGDDEDRMRALYEQSVDFAPETETDEAALAAILDVVPCPYGCWNLCAHCRDDPEGPSVRLAVAYRDLADLADPALADLLRPPLDEDGEAWRHRP